MGAHVRQERAIQLHLRLIQRDPLAPAELVEACIEELVRRLRIRAGPICSDTFLYDAAADTLLAYVQDPEKFDPSKSGLLTYLTMSAYGDLRNMLQKEHRRKKHEILLDDVEHRLFARNNTTGEAEDTELTECDVPDVGKKDSLMERIVAEFPDPLDLVVLRLILSGERKTSAFSDALGIRSSSKEEQRQIVKRHKDKIIKRLKRLGKNLRGSEKA